MEPFKSFPMDSEATAKETAFLNDLPDYLKNFDRHRGRLIPILQKVQQGLSYLPAEAIQIVAEYLAIPVSEVYGVATFYNQFRFTPPGKYPIKVCLGTACHVKGGEIILENFERKLEIKEGETTEDREFSIERVACVGVLCPGPGGPGWRSGPGTHGPQQSRGAFYPHTGRKGNGGERKAEK